MKTKLYQQLFTAVVRHALTFGGGLLVTNGFTDAATEQTIIGGLMALAGVAWSYFQKRSAHTVLTDALNANA